MPDAEGGQGNGDGTDNEVASHSLLVNRFKEISAKYQQLVALSQRSQVAREAAAVPQNYHDTWRATRGSPRGLAKSDQQKYGNGDGQAQTWQKTNPSCQMDVGRSGEAKGGEIEERRKVACAGITQARNCVAATKPFTPPVAQEMDTDK